MHICWCSSQNIYAEATFICPSYWMAKAYSGSSGANSRSSYRYQYSVAIPYHGDDDNAYFSPVPENVGPDFAMAFMRIWGNFVTQNSPSILNSVANGASSTDPTAPNPVSMWPEYSIYAPCQMNLNQTGGTLVEVMRMGNGDVTEFVAPGQMNSIELVKRLQLGRWKRCKVWLLEKSWGRSARIVVRRQVSSHVLGTNPLCKVLDHCAAQPLLYKLDPSHHLTKSHRRALYTRIPGNIPAFEKRVGCIMARFWKPQACLICASSIRIK